MAVFHITKENFEQEVLRSEKTVILDFFADWCGPCRMIAPILADIAEEREDIKVCKINVDEEAELAMQFQVMSIPLLVIMKDGQIINQSLGVRPKGDTLAMIP